MGILFFFSRGTPRTRGLSDSEPQRCVSDQDMGGEGSGLVHREARRNTPSRPSWTGWRPILQGGCSNRVQYSMQGTHRSVISNRRPLHTAWMAPFKCSFESVDFPRARDHGALGEMTDDRGKITFASCSRDARAITIGTTSGPSIPPLGIVVIDLFGLGAFTTRWWP